VLTHERYLRGVDPVDALERIATLLERELAPSYKAEAFRRAADAIRDRYDLDGLATRGTLRDIPSVGTSTARVIEQALAGDVPEYLAQLEAEAAPDAGAGADLHAALRGDLHTHSDWSDGGATIEQMALAARGLGHDYVALTDHSPSLKIASGLDADRLRAQLDVVGTLDEELAPFRILTGIEVDILEDGSLDQDEDLLDELDVVVASVHSKLRMEKRAMTDRMVAAIASPHVDVLGHCTGRLIRGRGRPESDFDPDLVFGACAHFDVAVEVNCRPERLDPPMRLLEQVAAAGCRISIDSDAHAVGQLSWQPYGCARGADAGLTSDRVVNTSSVDKLLEWATP